MSASLRRLTQRTLIIAVCVAALGLVDCGSSSSGSVTASLAAAPQELATQLEANDAALREAIGEWRAAEDPPSSPPPAEVTGPAQFLQRTVRFLASHPNVSGPTLAQLPGALAGDVRDLVIASRKLRKLSGGARRKLKVGAPPPISELLSHYREAEQRHGIATHYLAAIHLVETKFSRVKSKSVAGATGPMQFIPSTWRIHGKGNINDPHDAIIAAANLLRHSGAPRSYGRALFAYNPSKLYVDAVSRYAKLMARNSNAVFYLYCWVP
jgi:soluble lytic murein transglycosylase-like protein